MDSFITNKENICYFNQLIDNIHGTFDRLKLALKSRELSLLKQLDFLLLQNQQLKMNVVFNNELEILKSIMNFGLIDFTIDESSIDQKLYAIVDKQTACDHICLHKCVQLIDDNDSDKKKDILDEDLSFEFQSEIETDCCQEEEKTITDSVHLDNCSSSSSISLEFSDEDEQWLQSAKKLQQYKEYINNSTNRIDNKYMKLKTLKYPQTTEVLLYSDEDDEDARLNETTITHELNNDTQVNQRLLSNVTRSEEDVDRSINESEVVIQRLNDEEIKTTTERLINDEMIRQLLIDENKLNCDDNNHVSGGDKWGIDEWIREIKNQPECDPVLNIDILEHINISSTI